jgi:hypothetical protein
MMANVFTKAYATTGDCGRGEVNYGAIGLNAMPTEAGVVQRVSDLASGLEDLNDQIEGLLLRLAGDLNPNKACANTAPRPPGIKSALTEAQGQLNRAFSMISALSKEL